VNPRQGSSQPLGCTECRRCSGGLPSNFSPVHRAPFSNLSARAFLKQKRGGGSCLAPLAGAPGRLLGSGLGPGSSRALQQVSLFPQERHSGPVLMEHTHTKSRSSSNRADMLLVSTVSDERDQKITVILEAAPLF